MTTPDPEARLRALLDKFGKRGGAVKAVTAAPVLAQALLDVLAEHEMVEADHGLDACVGCSDPEVGLTVYRCDTRHAITTALASLDES